MQAHHMSRCTKLNNGSWREIQKVITFHTEVRFRRIIFRDARNWTEALQKFKMVKTFHTEVLFRRMIYQDVRNWTTEALEKFKWSKFWYGCPIQVHNISRHWLLNNGCPREIQMVINFYSDVRFRRIIYRDSRNSTTEALEKLKWL